MKIPRFNTTIIIALMAAISGCAPNSNTKQTTAHATKEDIDNRPLTAKEGFSEFYTSFNTDSVYQASHIIFPLMADTYDLDAEQFVSSKVSADEWQYLNFEELKKGYYIKINAAGDTTTVDVQAKETGEFVTYYFTTVDNKWMLVKIVDQST